MATLVSDAGVRLPYMYTVHTDLPTFALAHTCGPGKEDWVVEGESGSRTSREGGEHMDRDATFDCKSFSCWLWSWEAFC